jgi:hypothetical protein
VNEQDTPAELRDTVDATLAVEAAQEQGLLFTDDVSPLPSDQGYRGPTACNAAGITYRQLDYWARTGLVEPTVRGASGYECTSNDEVIDLLQGGQGVFGIAIGGVWREIEGTLADLPSERSVDAAEPSPGDELAARRAARTAG